MILEDVKIVLLHAMVYLKKREQPKSLEKKQQQILTLHAVTTAIFANFGSGLWRKSLSIEKIIKELLVKSFLEPRP